MVGGPSASVAERSRPRPCMWCPPWRRGAGGGGVEGGRDGGGSDCPILPSLSALLAVLPPLAPTSPQLRAPWLDVEHREETRSVEAGARTAAEPGP